MTNKRISIGTSLVPFTPLDHYHMVPLVQWSIVDHGPKEEEEVRKKRKRRVFGVLWCQVSNGHIYSNNMNNTFIPCTVPMVELHIHKIDNTDKRVDSVGIRIQDGLSRIDGAVFVGLSESDQIKLVTKVIKVAIKGNNEHKRLYLESLKKAV